jgi:NarL family two-component system response regulator YdfI
MVVKVFISANSAIELAGLKALIASAPGIELAGSSLDRYGLIEEIQSSRPDLLLEYWAPDDSDELEPEDRFDVPRLLMVAEPNFNAARSMMDTIGWAAGGSAVRGILPTWANEREIRVAIEAAAAGLLVLHPDVADHETVMPRAAAPTPLSPLLQQLSPREAEILNLLAEGLANKEIAWRLKISEHTVKFHLTSIFNKLNASGRAEAVAIGIRRGLIVL